LVWPQSMGEALNLSIVSIVVLVVCIVVAELLLEGVRRVAELPWGDGFESAVAAGIGALVWALISPKLKRA
jgi:hypothetical protein